MRRSVRLRRRWPVCSRDGVDRMKRVLKVYSDGEEETVIIRGDHREINPWPLAFALSIFLWGAIWFVAIALFGR